ncbi:MAG: hypothetical protein RL226_315 [Bacteroidota bacterium]|jgi:tetratricopeptide (TPR) repeat protein
MKLFTYIFFAIALLSGLSCATSKSFAKKGQKLEEAGLLEEAANMYLTSLQKNRGNIDAKIGMKSTGQVVLNKYLQEFAQKKEFGNKKEAIQSYQLAEKYRQRVSALGVELTIADFYKADFNSIKQTYMDELYDKGLQLMDEQKFSEAEAAFREISSLDPSYADAGSLADVAYMEPIYKKGVEHLEAGLYRAAYNDFQAIHKRTTSYKDSKNLEAQALKDGMYTIAMLPFENSTKFTGLDSKVAAYALEALTSVKDPFLKIVDRNNMALILEEQQLGLSGVINEQTAVSVGELLGAQAFITGTVLSYSKIDGQPTKTDREGFKQYQVKRLNKEDNKYYYETKYERTTYREYYDHNKVVISFQYKLVSLKTGEILQSKIVEKEKISETQWVEYDDDVQYLFPSAGNGPNTNPRAKKSLMEMMGANRTPRNHDELTNDAFQQITAEMKTEIAKLMNELVK